MMAMVDDDDNDDEETTRYYLVGPDNDDGWLVAECVIGNGFIVNISSKYH